jgi:hypothetical protein
VLFPPLPWHLLPFRPKFLPQHSVLPSTWNQVASNIIFFDLHETDKDSRVLGWYAVLIGVCQSVRRENWISPYNLPRGHRVGSTGISTLPLTSGLHGGAWLTPRPRPLDVFTWGNIPEGWRLQQQRCDSLGRQVSLRSALAGEKSASGLFSLSSNIQHLNM